MGELPTPPETPVPVGSGMGDEPTPPAAVAEGEGNGCGVLPVTRWSGCPACGKINGWWAATLGSEAGVLERLGMNGTVALFAGRKRLNVKPKSKLTRQALSYPLARQPENRVD